MRRRTKRNLACGLLALLIMQPSASAQQRTTDAGFRVVEREHGITVSVRDEPGRQVPTFRGTGALKGSVLHLLAIMLDDARAQEWATGADETAVLRKLDERTNIVYSRSKQPWPVHDRDLIMKRSVEVLEPGRAFRVRLSCVPGEKPPLDGVVRVKRCETTLTLEKLDDATTFVDYQVSVDPGGSIPEWLVKRTSKRMPLDTLVGLEKQVKKTEGEYRSVEAFWANTN
jgi:hypothetical protein